MSKYGRYINLGPYKIYRGTQSLLTIVPAGVRKTFELKEGDIVKIIIVDDGWLVIPVRNND